MDKNKSKEIDSADDGDASAAAAADAMSASDDDSEKKKPAASAAADSKPKRAPSALPPSSAAAAVAVDPRDTKIAELTAEIDRLKKEFDADLALVKSQLSDVERESAKDAADTAAKHQAEIDRLSGQVTEQSGVLDKQRKELSAHSAEHKLLLSQLSQLNRDIDTLSTTSTKEKTEMIEKYDAEIIAMTKTHTNQINELKIDQQTVLHKLTGLHKSEIKIRYVVHPHCLSGCLPVSLSVCRSLGFDFFVTTD